MRGMTMSQVMYLATRYSLHREALHHEDIKNMFDREGMSLDDKAVREWSQHLAENTHLDDVFTPRPPEAL